MYLTPGDARTRDPAVLTKLDISNLPLVAKLNVSNWLDIFNSATGGRARGRRTTFYIIYKKRAPATCQGARAAARAYFRG